MLPLLRNPHSFVQLLNRNGALLKKSIQGCLAGNNICNKEQESLMWSPSVSPQIVRIKQAMRKLLELTSLGTISNNLRESFALGHEEQWGQHCWPECDMSLTCLTTLSPESRSSKSLQCSQDKERASTLKKMCNQANISFLAFPQAPCSLSDIRTWWPSCSGP